MTYLYYWVFGALLNVAPEASAPNLGINIISIFQMKKPSLRHRKQIALSHIGHPEDQPEHYHPPMQTSFPITALLVTLSRKCRSDTQFPTLGHPPTPPILG